MWIRLGAVTPVLELLGAGSSGERDVDREGWGNSAKSCCCWGGRVRELSLGLEVGDRDASPASYGHRMSFLTFVHFVAVYAGELP